LKVCTPEREPLSQQLSNLFTDVNIRSLLPPPLLLHVWVILLGSFSSLVAECTWFFL